MSAPNLDQRRDGASSTRKHKPFSQAEAERRDRVLTFRQWCNVNNFSLMTGRRIVKSGSGPPILQLSARRIGIRETDNAAWQASRVRG